MLLYSRQLRNAIDIPKVSVLEFTQGEYPKSFRIIYLAYMNDFEASKKISDAFGEMPRPEHFTNYRHCDECEEHDELLRSHNLETLSLADVENPGWNPICFVTEEGFKYWMPALARLALEPEVGPPNGWYLPQLLFHLNHKGTSNRHLAAASLQQRNAVAQFLIHIEDTRPALVNKYGVEEELKLTIDLWA